MLLKADRETARHFLPGVSRSVLQQKVIKAVQEEPVVRANEDWSPGLITAYPFKDSLLSGTSCDKECITFSQLILQIYTSASVHKYIRGAGRIKASTHWMRLWCNARRKKKLEVHCF